MDAPEPKIRPFDWFILGLSIYVVIELYLSLVLDYAPWVRTTTEWADFGICMIFIGDFFVRYKGAEDRRAFVAGNWIDLASSIPMVGMLRAGRIARIFRIFRLLRSGRVFVSLLQRHQSINTFQLVLVLNVLLVALSAIALFQIERDANPFFETIGDAVWWSVITTTTLGFVQDVAPITAEGKVLSVFLIMGGLLLFGTFTAMVADHFISDEDIVERLKHMDERMLRIEEKLDQLNARGLPRGEEDA